uniref:glucuronosyltransferase n=1 Tax=Parastrongyloides trichosuri TaxID=131310 RepID=A0A0N4Z514_PARTI
MCFKKVSIIIFIFFKLFLYIKCINLPLAPFQIKIQCKSGLQKGDGEVIKNKEICPSSSTSCGYFEIPMKNENISIFECVDSSILSGEDDQEESAKELLFSQICNHIPKCQVINIALLNPSFKKYLINTYKLSSNVFEKKYIIFCCSMNSAVLEKTIKLKDRTQKVKSSNLLIKCDGKTCGVGAIGCLSYQQIPKARIVNAQDYIDVENDNKDFYSDETYIDEDNIKNKEITDDNSYDNDNIYIEPVQIEFNNEFNQDYMKKRFVRSTDKEYNCVYPHLNDEIYRYCSMIYTNSNKDRCFKGKGFKICCCYVRPEALTCDPEQKELPPIITLPPKISLPITTTQTFCILLIIDGVKCAKILIYTPSYTGSHIMVNGKIADTLIKEGHDVTMLILDYDSSVKFNGTKLGKVVRMGNLSSTYEKLMGDWLTGDDNNVAIPDMASVWTRYRFEKVANSICELIIQRRHELDFLKDEQFDLGFVEMLEYCGHGILHYLGVKQTAWISTTPLHDIVAWNFALPVNPNYIPSVEENFNGPAMTFTERLINTKQLLTQLILQYVSSEMCTSLFRIHVDKSFPNLRNLAANSTLGFVMTDEILDVPRPILHKIIYIGGLGFSKTNLLNSYWDENMKMGEKGVILFSMGTGASFSLFPLNKKLDVLKAFSDFPDYHFILKINKDDNVTGELVKDYKNVVVTTWMPQSDLLAHPNMKLFITHGGIGSLIESHMNGVPMIVIPAFADQQRNAKFVEWRGTGRALLRSELCYLTLKSAIDDVLGNNNYKRKVQRIQKLIKTKPGAPEQKLIEWTNYALLNEGLVEFNSPANELSIIVYYGVDILLFIMLSFITLIYILIKFCTFVLSKSKTKTVYNKKMMKKKNS